MLGRCEYCLDMCYIQCVCMKEGCGGWHDIAWLSIAGDLDEWDLRIQWLWWTWAAIYTTRDWHWIDENYKLKQNSQVCDDRFNIGDNRVPTHYEWVRVCIVNRIGVWYFKWVDLYSRSVWFVLMVCCCLSYKC